jgi:hypothetical protein
MRPHRPRINQSETGIDVDAISSYPNMISSGPGRIPFAFACPECGGELIWVPPRVFDRLLRWVKPVHRFRCTGPQCEYKGNLYK